MVTDAVVTFVKSIPPFQYLPENELRRLAGTISLEYFPRGKAILTAGSKASDSLYIVQKGAVKLTIRTELGEEVPLDMRSEGEIFGLLSVVGGNRARLDVTALEDTLCYSLPWSEMQRIITSYPNVASHFIHTSVTRYMDRSLSEIRSRSQLLGNSERLLYSLTVGELVARPPLLCDMTTTAQAAAELLAKSDATCLFVTDDEGRAQGIVTDKDFSVKIVALKLPAEMPVTLIMSSPVVSIEASEPAFQALVLMLGNNIHHILVTQDGVPKGAISHHDLLLLQSDSPLSIVRDIAAKTDVESLAVSQDRIGHLIPLLMREGARASHITRVVAELNDHVLNKILQLAESKLGKPPAPYCWVVLGSEGRREQTFKTDQDNGLIYADLADERQPAAAQYFAEFADFVHKGLTACGYPPCPGGYMASNARWRQPLAQWKRYFYQWIKDPSILSAQDAVIFFDMRPVGGDLSLYHALEEYVRDLLASAGLFKSVLAYLSIMHKPPLGFFRTLVVERGGEHKHELDLKLNGTSPIVHAARLFAIDVGIARTGTLDRLLSLQAIDYQDPQLLNDLHEAYEFLLLLRLERQLEQKQSGLPPSNYVNPESLTALQKSTLKEAFQTVARTQSLVESHFRTAVWAQLDSQVG